MGSYERPAQAGDALAFGLCLFLLLWWRKGRDAPSTKDVITALAEV